MLLNQKIKLKKYRKVNKDKIEYRRLKRNCNIDLNKTETLKVEKLLISPSNLDCEVKFPLKSLSFLSLII